MPRYDFSSPRLFVNAALASGATVTLGVRPGIEVNPGLIVTHTPAGDLDLSNNASSHGVPAVGVDATACGTAEVDVEEGRAGGEFAEAPEVLRLSKRVHAARQSRPRAQYALPGGRRNRFCAHVSPCEEASSIT